MNTASNFNARPWRKLISLCVVAAASLLPLSALANCTLVANNTAATPDARFTDRGDGTVVDNTTQLMWTKGPLAIGRLAQAAAQTAADNSTFAGYTDWRLPTRSELSGIVETACSNPAINTTMLTLGSTSTFWTSEVAGQAAFSVDFTHGISQTESNGLPKAIRLVRSAAIGIFADGFE